MTNEMSDEDFFNNARAHFQDDSNIPLLDFCALNGSEKDELIGRVPTITMKGRLRRIWNDRQQQQQGKIICKIPIHGCSFNIC
jgi:hypothetical protein